jgi:putative PIN family toxin of toxin-antitoxin system
MPVVARVVLDTNVVLSALLFQGGNPSVALLKAQNGQLLGSDETLLELAEVMNRPRFDRYFERSIRQKLVAEYFNACEAVPVLYPIRACRDPKDDKFLEVAVHGRADAIVTGDADLLDLNPFRGIAIITPREYLERE